MTIIQRNEETTQKLINFYNLYENKNKDKHIINEDYVWKEIDNLKKWKNLEKDEDLTVQDFIHGNFILDPIFETREDENIDWSFLKSYSKNIQELLIRQILLDFRKKWPNSLDVLSKLLSKKVEKVENVETNSKINSEKRETLYKYINTIDEFILILEFFNNPPKSLRLVDEEKELDEKLLEDFEVEEILKKVI